jgi:restriction system protein
MSRRRGLFSELLEAPWWASVIIAAIVYAGLKWGMPLVGGDHFMAEALAQALSNTAGVIALVFLIPAPFAAYRSWRARQTFAKTTSLADARDLSWQEFETLIATAYRRLGYQVRERGGAQADGGVDLELEEEGGRTLVQCKQWNRQTVGVSVVRELYGVMIAENAKAAIIVTSGVFSEEAVAFAKGKPIELVNGRALEKLLALAHGVDPEAKPEPPACPKCGSTMVLRTTKRGPRARNEFWGCPKYPGCKGTRSL